LNSRIASEEFAFPFLIKVIKSGERAGFGSSKQWTNNKKQVRDKTSLPRLFLF
jgi:hypothetical protein